MLCPNVGDTRTEHRYYGLSNPFGSGALGRGYNVSFLTVEQAMEDFSALNVRLRARSIQNLIGHTTYQKSDDIN